jgi:FlaG/FlaF family flagellin (archaellin)
MVAITVILAAVIGTFVLGLGDQIGGSATAGVTVDGDNTSEVTVTLTNLGTAEEVTIVDTDGNAITPSTGSLPMSNTGASVTLNNSGSLAGGTYNVVAVGPEGEESVLRSFEVAP